MAGLPVNQQHMSGETGNSSNLVRSDNCSVGNSPTADNELDEYLFNDTKHPKDILLGLNNLRLSKTLCDVTLCVDKSEFVCHRIVLASFSPYFRAMFSGELAESRQDKVVLSSVEALMIDLLLNYAYTGSLLITKDNVQSLLSASDLLGVLPVKEACCKFLKKNISESNCLGIWCFAEALHCYDLEADSKAYSLENFLQVTPTEEFLTLPSSKLIDLISDDRLNVKNEEAVFNSIITWLEYDLNTHLQDFEAVFENVRLPLLSPYFIVDTVETYELIRKSGSCQKCVDEAKKYHLLKDRRAELASPRTRPRTASGLTEVIIAVGGEDDTVVLRSVECFEPYTGQWRTLACLPFAVSKHGLVTSGSNHLYMAGGEYPDGSASRSMWRYDPCFDTWQELADMNVPRSELGVALLDGYVYAVGGWEGVARLDSIEYYDISTNTWHFVAPMKMALTSPAVAALHGLLYVTGGAVLEDGDGIDLVQQYNPKTNKWTRMKPMLIPRSGSASCVLNGNVYVIGGWHASTENTNKVERFDPLLEEWENCAPMNERRYRPGVAVVDGKIFVLGGEEGWDRYHDTIEKYDPDDDTWTIVGEMPTSRSWLSCISMRIHKEIYVTGKPAGGSTCMV